MDVTVNGEPRAVPPTWQEDTLLFVLRKAFGLTGARFGCGQGLCGACTVLLDDAPVRSCLVPVAEAAGRAVRNRRRVGRSRRFPPGPGGLAGRGGAAMRLLPGGPDRRRGRAAGARLRPDGRGRRRRAGRQPLSLRHLWAHPPGPSGRPRRRGREPVRISGRRRRNPGRRRLRLCPGTADSPPSGSGGGRRARLDRPSRWRLCAACCRGRRWARTSRPRSSRSPAAELGAELGGRSASSCRTRPG